MAQLSSLEKIYTCRSDSCSSDLDGSYLSVNGSKMRFEHNELQTDGKKRDILYLPDGSRYILPLPSNPNNPTTDPNDNLTVFIDVDGNKMQYEPVQNIWTDSLGRQIQNSFVLPMEGIAYPSSENPQSINLPGLPGQTDRLSSSGKSSKARNVKPIRREIAVKVSWKTLLRS
jgi:hypothetical protein